MNSAFHSMFVHLLTGAFAMTVLALFIRIYVQRWKKELIPTVGKYTDFMIWVTALAGFLLFFAALVTGALIWPMSAVLNSSILKNKIFTAILMMIFWGLVLFMRYKYRQDLWRNNLLAMYYSLLAIGAFFWGTVTNSVGGDIAGNSSGFEYIFHLIGVDTRWSFYLPTPILLMIVGLGVAAVVLPSFINRTEKSKPSEEF